jgi:glutamate synthase (NADPH/NADH) large chain
MIRPALFDQINTARCRIISGRIFHRLPTHPIDSLREYRVMSLENTVWQPKECVGRKQRANRDTCSRQPFVGNAQWQELTRQFNANLVEIDCTFDLSDDAMALQSGLERIRSEAEDAVRSGAGHLVLTDHHSGPEKVAMPMILATSAVHSHLTRKGLRTFTSLNVRSAECVDPHYFAVIIGAGATVVNAYLAEDSLADRIERGLLEGSLTEIVSRYRNAIDQGLLKIMAKMGISVISSYRGGLNFEAVGLSRAYVR